jgi:hypothetical protein
MIEASIPRIYDLIQSQNQEIESHNNLKDTSKFAQRVKGLAYSYS